MASPSRFMFLLKHLPFCRGTGHCLQQVLMMDKQGYGVKMVSLFVSPRNILRLKSDDW